MNSRLIVAILIALVGGSAITAASGYVVRDAPETFHAAQPLPGDRAEWAYTIIDEDGISENALPWLQLEILPDQWTHNAAGEPVLVRMHQTNEVGYDSYDPDDDSQPAEFGWRGWMRVASTDDGVVWHEQAEEWDPWSSSNILGTETRREAEGSGRIYRSGTGPLLENCLLMHLPQRPAVPSSYNLPECVASTNREHPDAQRKTGKELADRDAVSIGLHVTGSWVPIGSGETPHGTALVLAYDFLGEEVQAWFVEDIPYPVRLVVPYEGRVWVHQMTDFERGEPVAAAINTLAVLPPVDLRPLRHYGADEAGIDFPMMPSEAWEIALDDEDLNLQEWLDEHPEAFVMSMVGDTKEDMTYWQFSLLEGEATFGFIVELHPMRVPDSYLDLPGPLTETTVRTYPAYVGAGIEKPTQVPDLASAAARLQAMTGLPATGFSYRIGFGSGASESWPDRVPVVMALGQSVTGSNSVMGSVQAEEQTTIIRGLSSDVEGNLDYLTFRQYDITSTPFQSAPTKESQPMSDVIPADESWQLPATAAVGLGAATGLLAVLYYFWPQLKGLVLGFSRIKKDDLLNHPNRQRLYDAIEETPGIHQTALVELLGQGRGTASHHLAKMVDGGLIRARDGHGYTCYFLAATDRHAMDAAPVLRSDTARQLLDFVKGHPGATGGHVADALGINRSTVSHHLKRLEAVGLVAGQRDGRAIRIWPQEVQA